MSIPKFIFIHIEKTAGNSLRHVLENNFSLHEIYHVYENSLQLNDFRCFPRQRKDAVKLFIGHFGFGVHRRLGLSQFRYATVLREPVERVISLYYYLKRAVDHARHPVVKNMTLEEFVCSGILPFVDNGQTRRISGELDVPFKGLTEAALDKAKGNLESHFSVVGLLERFDETLVLLQEEYSLQDMDYLHKNVSMQRPAVYDISETSRTLVERFNRLDMELYRYASQRFSRQVEAGGTRFLQRLDALTRSNAHYREALEHYGRSLRPARPGHIGEASRLLDSLPGWRSRYPELAAKAYFILANFAGDTPANAGNRKVLLEKGLLALEQKKIKNEEEFYMEGSLKKQLGDFPAASETFLYLIRHSQLTNITAGAYFHLGDMELRRGNNKKAAVLFRSALKWNPLHRKAEEYLEGLDATQHQEKIL